MGEIVEFDEGSVDVGFPAATGHLPAKVPHIETMTAVEGVKPPIANDRRVSPRWYGRVAIIRWDVAQDNLLITHISRFRQSSSLV